MRKIKILRLRPELPDHVEPRQSEFKFQFFYPASPFPHKRVDLACEAVIRAAQQDSDIGLVVTVADGVASGSAHVKALNYLSHAQALEYMAGCDALLFTSDVETLGLPLLEALGFERPAVLPELPYAREIYGDAGCYYSEQTPDAVSDAIHRLRNNIGYFKQRVAERKAGEWQKRAGWAEHWPHFMTELQGATESGRKSDVSEPA